MNIQEVLFAQLEFLAEDLARERAGKANREILRLRMDFFPYDGEVEAIRARYLEAARSEIAMELKRLISERIEAKNYD